MTYNNLPPQAYTKETVSDAFTWLQTQPEEVKSQASDTNRLVQMYLSTKRKKYWSAENEAPVSSKKFRDDLQELATELTQFEAPPAPKSQPVNKPGTERKLGSDSSASLSNVKAPPQSLIAEARPQPAPATPPKVTSFDALDYKSQNWVRDVKGRFNLSSESEALRLLIALGYQKAKAILPDPD